MAEAMPLQNVEVSSIRYSPEPLPILYEHICHSCPSFSLVQRLFSLTGLSRSGFFSQPLFTQRGAHHENLSGK
jgi:hypothetical protein